MLASYGTGQAPAHDYCATLARIAEECGEHLHLKYTPLVRRADGACVRAACTHTCMRTGQFQCSLTLTTSPKTVVYGCDVKTADADRMAAYNALHYLKTIVFDQQNALTSAA
jgi:hypothetical protein